MALEPGTTLGHYGVTALIGEGGMGQVRQATDMQLHRDVARKILPRRDDPADAVIVADVGQDARLPRIMNAANSDEDVGPRQVIAVENWFEAPNARVAVP